MSESPPSAESALRRQALRRLFIWAAIFAVCLTIPLVILPHFHRQPTPLGMIPLALPGAFALAALMELITGVPFAQIARRWDSLKGWQRGILGTIIVLVAGFLIICGFTFFAMK